MVYAGMLAQQGDVFEGRYPLRPNIFTAIVTTDLANSQVSPFESTTPKILKSADYTSALFGKFHLAGQTNNPYGDGTPNSLGFDHFDGFLEGAPHPIDTTAGGVYITDNSNPQFPKVLMAADSLWRKKMILPGSTAVMQARATSPTSVLAR